MKITIIYGKMGNDSTYNCVQLLLNQINSKINSQVTEFFLPKDLPHFCCGCFSCFINPEYTCPHFNDVYYIMKSLEESDLIILASPVYTCTTSIQMKSLLDHISYRWMPHREGRPSMSDKVGIVLSTTDGSVSSTMAKSVKNSLRFWGIKKIFKISNNMSSMHWKTIDLEAKRKFNKKIINISNKILALNEKSKKITSAIPSKIAFTSMRPMKKEDDFDMFYLNRWQNQDSLNTRNI